MIEAKSMVSRLGSVGVQVGIYWGVNFISSSSM
jgi:hypothetical protein